MNAFPNIYGFNKCSEIGTNVFAPSIFFGACNLRCPYCMNCKLVINYNEIEPISIDTVKKYVEEDSSEWIMISGGEPTCSNTDEILNLLNEIRSWGCKIGMSTNGVDSERLRPLLSFINYVALDVKGGREAYNNILVYKGTEWSKEPFTNVIVSKSLLTENKLARNDFDYEVRTTLYPSFIDKVMIENIGGIMRKDDIWILQQFRHSKNMIDENCKSVIPYNEKEVNDLLKIAEEYSNKVELRYV